MANRLTEFIIKDKNQMPIIELQPWQFYNPFVGLKWQQWIGAAVFFWGWLHQYSCHAILVCIGSYNLLLWCCLNFKIFRAPCETILNTKTNM